MTKTKKILSMTLALLLAINALVIGASAVIGDGNELSVDVNLEVGWQTGDVFTPLAPGEELQAGDVITVRICPTNDFWVGVTRYIVMYSKTKFKVVGEQKDAFTPNYLNPFWASVASAWTGATGQAGAGVPTQGWPASMRSTTAGGDGTFDNYTAVAVNNQAGPASASGGYPGIMSTGEWLFRFSLTVQEDITDASQARIWMDERWLATPDYLLGAMYFAKCTGPDQLAAFGKANTYFYDMDLTGADVYLPLEGGVETSTITFDSAGGTAVDPITGNVGDPVVAPADPTKEGYTFASWDPALPDTYPAGGFSTTATWTANSYNADFYVDGALYQTVPTDFGAQIDAPADPVKEGYTFTGWDPVPGTMGAADASFDAVFSINTYDAVFNVDGSVYATVPTEYGAQIAEPADPVKEGYTFTGWTPEVGVMPEGGASFDAVFTANTYDANFYVDGILYETVPTEFGAQIIAPADPVKTGYDFAGWDPAVGAMGAADQDFDATWTPASGVTYTVNTYMQNTELSGYDLTNSQQYAGTTGETVTITPSAVEGFTFNEAGSTVSGEITADGSLVLSVYYTRNSYTISFYVDGSVYDSLTQAYGTVVAGPADPAKTGYTFTGWDPALPGTMPSADIDVNAVFNANTYDAVFNVDGVLYATVPTVFGEQIQAPADPAAEGYTFSGWDAEVGTMDAEGKTFNGTLDANIYNATFYVDDELYGNDYFEFGEQILTPPDPVKEGATFTGWNPVPGTMPANDVRFDAVFSTQAYNAYFYVDGELYATVPTEFGAQISAPADPAKEGYTFAGWDPEPGTMGAGDETFNATFTKNSYIAYFMVDEIVYNTATVAFGDPIPLPADPSKEGSTFTGWDDVPGAMPADNVVINAVFDVNAYNAVFMVDGVEYESVLTEYGEAIDLPADPTKEGYTFTSWDLVPEAMPANDVIITAQFSVNTYNAVFMVDGAVYETVPTEFGAPIAIPANPTKDGFLFTGWDPVPGNMGSADETFTAQFIDDPTDYSVVYARFNDSYYGQLAPIEVKVTGRPMKIQFYRLANGATMTFDRRLSTQIVSIQGYDADDNPVSTVSEDLAYEIWMINIRLLQDNYVVRARYFGEAFEAVEVSKPLTVVYDTYTTTFDVSAATVLFGSSVDFTAVTGLGVSKIQLFNALGNTMTYDLTDGVHVDNTAEGTRTWVITRPSGGLGEYTWMLKTKIGTAWTDTGLSVSYTVETTSFDTAFTVSDTTILNGESVVFTVTTSTDVTKVQLFNAQGSTMTFDMLDGVHTDNDVDGTRTWVITRPSGGLGEYTWMLKTKIGSVWTDTGLSVSYSVV